MRCCPQAARAGWVLPGALSLNTHLRSPVCHSVVLVTLSLWGQVVKSLRNLALFWEGKVVFCPEGPVGPVGHLAAGWGWGGGGRAEQTLPQAPSLRWYIWGGGLGSSWQPGSGSFQGASRTISHLMSLGGRPVRTAPGAGSAPASQPGRAWALWAGRVFPSLAPLLL